MILSLSLLLSTIVCATTVETNLTFTQGESVSTISETVKLVDDQDRISFEKDDVRCELIITSKPEDGSMIIQGAIYSINQDGTQELIASPVLSVEYDKPALVTVHDDCGNGWELVVTITKD
jgi:hypothetical protein